MDNLKPIRDIMKLITEDQPKETIFTEANIAKAKLTADLDEIQKAIKLIDSILDTFTLGDDTPLLSKRPHVPREFNISAKYPYIPTNEHILELAEKYKKNGMINTDLIVKQLKLEGDTRTDRGIAISVGNILHHSRWTSAMTGLYNEPPKEGVK